MANTLVDDLADTLVALVQANDSLFSNIGTSSLSPGAPELKVEYARDGLQRFQSGSDSVCRIYIVDVVPETNSFLASTFTNFTFRMIYDLIETRNGVRAKAIISSALTSIFASGGDEFFALLSEGTTENRLGGSGVVQILSVTEFVGRGDANCMLEALISIRLWHQIPLS